MKKRAQGARLAVALGEDWSRGFYFCFHLFWTCLLLAPGIGYLMEDRPAGNKGLFEVVFGLAGVALLAHLVRKAWLWRVVGGTVVEVSREPAPVGSTLEYFIRQGRASPSVRSVEARFLLTRRWYSRRRHGFKVELSVPLAAATVDPDGRHRIEGSLVVPDVPPSETPHRGKLEWILQVTMKLRSGGTHEEDHPIVVVATEGPR